MDESKYKKIELDCEICERSEFKQILSKGRIGRSGEYGPISIRQCRHCGHVMMNPRYEDQFYIDYYNNYYRDSVANFGGENPTDEFLDSRVIVRGERVLEHLESTHGLKQLNLLDLGCGYGATMIPFRNANWTVRGIDPESACIKFGQEKLEMPVDLGFAEDLPYNSNQFDVVLSLGALEHVHDFPAAMREVNRVTKIGGHLFIRMRHNRCWGLMWEYFNKNHYRFFCGDTHKLAVMRYGFEPVEYTDKQVEGRTGDRYLLCRKIGAPSLTRAEEAIAKGIRDSPDALRAYLISHHQSFLDKAKSLLAFEKNCDGDRAEMARQIVNGEYQQTLLFGDPEEQVGRAILEAHRVLEESANGEAFQ